MLRPVTVAATNLWSDATRFVGRELELAALTKLLTEARLVSILGPPGIGKTRLARQLGRQLSATYAHQVWFVDLTEAKAEADAVAAVARTLELGLRPGAVPAAEQVAAHLRGLGPLLLILDNFEQLAAVAAVTLDRWVRQAPEARLLVTSREVLRVDTESRYELEPLSEAEGVTLFEVRAQQVDPHFRVEGAAGPVVADIVKRLDRLPLAIELAAARIGVLSPAGLQARLGDRLTLLRSDRRGVAARLATLRGAIDWSWTMLNEAERIALFQCARFRGGFGLGAAEVVLDHDAAPVVELLESLRNRSLLRRFTTSGGEVRFGLYESIREFAQGSVVPVEIVAATEVRYRRYFLDRATGLFGRFVRGPAPEDLDQVALDLDNFLEVLRLSLDDSDPAALPLSEVVDGVLASRGPFELQQQLLDRGVALADRVGDRRARARARLRRAEARRVRGTLDTALDDLAQARSEGPGPGDLAEVIDLEGRIYGMQGRAEESIAAFTEELEVLADPSFDPWRRANAQISLAGSLQEARRYTEARAAYQRADQLLGQEPSLLLARLHYGLAVLCLEERDHPGAAFNLARAQETAERLGSIRLQALTRVLEGVRCLLSGAIAGAELALLSGRDGLAQVYDVRLHAFSRSWLAALWTLTDRLDAAAELFTQVAADTAREGDRILSSGNEVLSRLLPLAQARRDGVGLAVAAAAPEVDAIDVRLALQLVAQAGDPDPGGTIWPVLIQEDGLKFRGADGAWVSLERRPSLAQVLRALVAAHQGDPPATLSGEQLLAAGWPGEKVQPEAGQSRVYVALSTLRKLGLLDWIESHPDGYRLRPTGILIRPRF